MLETKDKIVSLKTSIKTAVSAPNPLQKFNKSLKPINKDPHRFELTKIGNNYISFKGVTDGSPKTLSYQRTKKDVFFIRLLPNKGDLLEIRLIPQN